MTSRDITRADFTRQRTPPHGTHRCKKRDTVSASLPLLISSSRSGCIRGATVHLRYGQRRPRSHAARSALLKSAAPKVPTEPSLSSKCSHRCLDVLRIASHATIDAWMCSAFLSCRLSPARRGSPARGCAAHPLWTALVRPAPPQVTCCAFCTVKVSGGHGRAIAMQ